MAQEAEMRAGSVERAGLMLWVPLCLAAGITLWLMVPGRPGHAVTYGAIATALASFGFIALRPNSRDGVRLTFAALGIVAIGLALMGQRVSAVSAPILSWRYYGPVEGSVAAIDRSSTDKLRVVLKNPRLGDLQPHETPALVRVSLHKGIEGIPQVGATVMLTAHLGPPPGPAEPGGFDFRRYAWFKSLGAVGYTRAPIMTIAPPAPRGAAFGRLRRTASQAIQGQIGGQAGAVTAALFTGDRSGISQATNQVMRDSNLYHLVSISGLHMGLVCGFSYQALRWVLLLSAQLLRAPGQLVSRAHKLAATGALSAGAGYLILSGGGVATERAFIMAAVMLGAIMVDRRAISLRSVAIAATLIMVWRPEAVLSAGFHMSFAATTALILSSRLWLRLRPSVPRLARPVLALLMTSAVAGFATAPFAAAHFGRISHYGLLANLLAVPVMGIAVMPAGVIAAVLAPIGAAGPAIWVAGLGTKWMLAVAEYVAGLDHAVSLVPLPRPWVISSLAFGAVLAIASSGAAFGIWRRRVGCTVASLLVASSALGWWLTPRPHLLIAPEGEAVMLRSQSGHGVPSKPKGGGFVTARWLEADGDVTEQTEAAGRDMWSGPSNARTAILPDGRAIWHMTGVGAELRARQVCRNGVLVVVDERVDQAHRLPCELIDLAGLRESGARSAYLDRSKTLYWRDVASSTGTRPWAGR